MRKASINFKQVGDIGRAMAHALRQEEKEPTYLLPKEHRRQRGIVSGLRSPSEVRTDFAQAKALMTGQARARGSSPYWEGILVLPEFQEPYQAYGKACGERLRAWVARYEELTGQKVKYATVHLDEGYMDGDTPVYNTHAHIFINRLDERGRVIKLGRSQLSKVQDMTAEVMGMERGETLEQRQGKRGRKHLDHWGYRRYAEAQRDAEQNYVQGFNEGAEAVGEDAARKAEMSARAAQRREAYLELRGLLKGSGAASQAHYSALKALYERPEDERFDKLAQYVVQDHINASAVLDYICPPEPKPSSTSASDGPSR